MDDTRFHHQRLRAWHLARELVRLVHSAPIGDSELRDQAKRAARSLALNLAEGAAYEGAGRRQFFRRSRGSIGELVAAYELASDIGEQIQSEPIFTLANRLYGSLTLLMKH